MESPEARPYPNGWCQASHSSLATGILYLSSSLPNQEGQIRFSVRKELEPQSLVYGPLAVSESHCDPRPSQFSSWPFGVIFKAMTKSMQHQYLPGESWLPGLCSPRGCNRWDHPGGLFFGALGSGLSQREWIRLPQQGSTASPGVHVQKKALGESPAQRPLNVMLYQSLWVQTVKAAPHDPCIVILKSSQQFEYISKKWNKGR
jgi:hypothetical protein